MRSWLPTLCTWILALGLLPSLTALSESFARAWPALHRMSGPINPLKLGLPLLVWWVWSQRRAIPKRLSRLLPAVWLVGTLSTLIAAAACGYPPMVLREWFVITAGGIAAMAFVLLPAKNQAWVIFALAFWVYGSAALEYVSPTAIDWLLNHVFDPATRTADWEVPTRPVSGVFSRQSIAKFFSWLPWLFFLFVFPMVHERYKKHKTPRARTKPNALSFLIPPPEHVGLFALIGISTALALASTQRGPMLGLLAGLAFYTAHQLWLTRNPRLLGTAFATLSVAAIAIWLLVPKEIIQSRFGGKFGTAGLYKQNPTTQSAPPSPQDRFTRNADNTVQFRILTNRLSWQVIRSHPLGHACLSKADFKAAGVAPAHAHNLFLEQLRTRGWLWGSLHLLLWLATWISCWRWKSHAGSLVLGAITATLVAGLVDHPWFVLNHAFVLNLLLFLGLSRSIGWTHSPARSIR